MIWCLMASCYSFSKDWISVSESIMYATAKPRDESKLVPVLMKIYQSIAKGNYAS